MSQYLTKEVAYFIVPTQYILVHANNDLHVAYGILVKQKPWT